MYYFIVNPASSSGNGLAIWNRLEEILKKEEVTYETVMLSQQDHASEAVSEITSRHEPCTIVAIGGDGTVNEIINGIQDFDQVTFSCIPSGSGNDFIRGMRMSTSPEDMLQAILHPKRTREINIGKVTAEDKSRCFAVSAGAGFDAAVCDSVQNSRLKKILNFFHLGKLVYTLTALWLLLTMKRQPLRIVVDGSRLLTYQKAYFAAIMNLRYEGGGFKFCPKAKAGDDLLDLCIAGNIQRWRTLFILPMAYFGRHVGKKDIDILQCSKVTIQNEEPLCIHTDGEIMGYYKKITVQLLPQKLNVITG